jgi:hypothetical protein
MDGAVEVGLGVEVDGHATFFVMRGLDPIKASCAGLTRASICYRNDSFEKMDCRVKPGNDGLEHHAATRFPFCAEPERLSPSRPRLFGAAE